MLNYEELQNIARLKRLSIKNAEKDYLQELLLFSIYSIASKELIFKGGTCLYKLYKLNRFSEDLDFNLTEKIDIKKFCSKVIVDLELINIKSKVKEIKEYKNEINVRFLINGPLYKGNKETQCFIPLNISVREQLLLEPKKHLIYTFYKEIPNFEVFSMDEREILAEKIRAIFSRQKPRDVYDLWFLAVQKNIAIDKKLIDKKLSLYSLNFNLKEFFRKIEEMKGLWILDLKNLVIQELPQFDKVKKELNGKFKSL